MSQGRTDIGRLHQYDPEGQYLMTHKIRTFEEVYIGRNPDHCRIIVKAPWISERHIRLYSIIYEEKVEPFLYAEDLSSQGNNAWLYKRKSTWERCNMEKGSIKLLSDGDRLRLCDGTVFRFRSDYIPSCSSSSPPASTEKDELRELEKDSFDTLLHITKRQLGEGGSAAVNMAVDRWHRTQVACKIVNLSNSGSNHVVSHHFRMTADGDPADVRARPLENPRAQGFRREIEILKGLSHPNIIGLQRVFFTKHTLYLIEDLVTGGDLQSYIDRETQVQKPGRYNYGESNEDACGIVFQILKALSYLHAKGDLKPENVLMSIPASNARVILTDFGGAAADLKTNPRRLKTSCGTADWLAPEVTRHSGKGYTKAVDMWSLGCLITALFTGSSIFANGGEPNARNSTSVIHLAAAKCDLSSLDNSPIWENVDRRAKQLTKALLVLDDVTRLTADEALRQPWFNEGLRARNLETWYNRIIAGWKPTRPSEDFEEDLKLFTQAGIPPTEKRRPHLSYNPPPLLLKPTVEAPQVPRKESSPIRDSSFIERPDGFKFGPPLSNPEPESRKKRKAGSSVTVDQDHDLRTEAWGGNRGLISAKEYDRKIAEKRDEVAAEA